jgi:hypothetical protein
MKKKLFAIVVFVLVIGFSFTACRFPGPGERVTVLPDLSYAVIGNGGSAVQVGNFVYFINGTDDLTDETGDTNRWGRVIKNGLYRAEFLRADGETQSFRSSDNTWQSDPYRGYFGDYKTFRPATKGGFSEDYNGFKLNSIEDFKGESKAFVEAVPIVNKKISSGIYVFGDWIYYTSPNANRSRQGIVQDELVDFYRTKHDGRGTQLLYTTTVHAEPGHANFGIYYYGGQTHLVVLDGDELFSIAAGSRRVSRPKLIASGVTSAVFPVKPVFYQGMSTDRLEDWVFYTRSATRDDSLDFGNVLVRVRPDGDSDTSFDLMNNGGNIVLNSLQNGHLYYTTQDSVSTKLFAHSFRGFPERDTAEFRENGIAGASTPVEVLFDTSNLSNLFVSSQITAFHDKNNPENDYTENVVSVTHFVIAARGGSTVSIVHPSSVETVILPTMAAQVLAVDGNYFYFVDAASGGVGTLFRANMFVPDAQQRMNPVSEHEAIISHVGVSAFQGYVFFVSTHIGVYDIEDKNASEETYKTMSGYMKVRHFRIDNEDEWTMGRRFKEADVPEPDPEDEDEEEDDFNNDFF